MRRSLMTTSSTSSCARDLGEPPLGDVALQVDVQERGGAAQRHRRAVLLLGGREVGQVQPLHGLLGGRGGPGHVDAVRRRHLGELTQRPDLLGQLLAVAHDLGGRAGVVERRLGGLPVLDQPGHAVERHPPVVADDPPAAVRVRQPGDQVGAPRGEDLRRVGVEHPGVVGLAVLREDLVDGRVQLVAVGLQPGLDHPQPAVRHDRALQRGVGLQADDDLPVAVQVARRVAGDGGGDAARRRRARRAPAPPRRAARGPPTAGWCARWGRPGSRPGRRTASRSRG